jgi:hypothetical protein
VADEPQATDEIEQHYAAAHAESGGGQPP